jgi:hypothetical protein
LDAPRLLGVAARERLVVTADKVMRDLEEIRLAALANGAFAPALRCVELQGKHIGLWKSETTPERSLAELLAMVPNTAPPEPT